MKLSKARKNVSNENTIELDYNEENIESPMFKRMKISSPPKRRNSHSQKTSGRRKSGEFELKKADGDYEELEKEDKKSDEHN